MVRKPGFGALQKKLNGALSRFSALPLSSLPRRGNFPLAAE
jgi:hypothetical protein